MVSPKAFISMKSPAGLQQEAVPGGDRLSSAAPAPGRAGPDGRCVHASVGDGVRAADSGTGEYPLPKHGTETFK